MDEELAREILGDMCDVLGNRADPTIKADGGLYSLSAYLSWDIGDRQAIIDGEFTADELEAIAWWMRNHPTNGKPQG